MASYDWFLGSINKINSDHPKLIGKEIYVILHNGTVRTGTIINVIHGIVKYKYVDSNRVGKYGQIRLSKRGKQWFINKDKLLEYLKKDSH